MTLFEAVQRSHAEALTELATQSRDVNEAFEGGRTALIEAAGFEPGSGRRLQAAACASTPRERGTTCTRSVAGLNIGLTNRSTKPLGVTFSSPTGLPVSS